MAGIDFHSGLVYRFYLCAEALHRFKKGSHIGNIGKVFNHAGLI